MGGVTRLNSFSFALIKSASERPSFGMNLLFSFRGNTNKMICLFAGGTEHPFRTVMIVCKNNVAISQKLLLKAKLVHSLFITYEALPAKAVTSIGMLIGIQFNWFTCHSKTTNKRVKRQAGHPSTTDFSALAASLGKPFIHFTVHIVGNKIQWNGNLIKHSIP